MKKESTPEAKALSNADLARVLSPLLLFLVHALYLTFWSPDPFLNKWLDGSFSFFVSLVLCNIVRAKVVARAAATSEDERAKGDRGPDADGGGTADGARPDDGQPPR